jgi:hypothetical protein
VEEEIEAEFYVFSRNLPGGTEERQEEPQWE